MADSTGDHLATIVARGRLRAGVSADTNLLAYRDPSDLELKGFDIDLVREIARALLGNPAAVDFVVISRSRRIDVLVDEDVDLVAHTFRMTCRRWEQVRFSSEYFSSQQRLLVRSDSTATSIEQLAGRRVCALDGSTTLEVVARYPVEPVGAAHIGDCLVRFQQGEVDAISSDESVLFGLAAQDPYAKVVGPSLADQPYGLAVSPQHPEMVGYLNSVLDELRRSGRLNRLYDRFRAVMPDIEVPAPDHRRRPA